VTAGQEETVEENKQEDIPDRIGVDSITEEWGSQISIPTIRLLEGCRKRRSLGADLKTATPIGGI